MQAAGAHPPHHKLHPVFFIGVTAIGVSVIRISVTGDSAIGNSAFGAFAIVLGLLMRENNTNDWRRCEHIVKGESEVEHCFFAANRPTGTHN